MIHARPYSSMLLALCGIVMAGIGLYFAFLRPALLPEDARYIGVSFSDVETALPHLSDWLHRVFAVMGGYMFTSGLLTAYLALTAFRKRETGIRWVIIAAGLTSIGWMAMINFMIASDFRWILLGFSLLWATAVGLYWIKP